MPKKQQAKVRKVNEGIYKMINGAMEKLAVEQFILIESWKKQKSRLQEQYPGAKIKYSYKTKQFTIEYGLPSDFQKMLSLPTKKPKK